MRQAWARYGPNCSGTVKACRDRGYTHGGKKRVNVHEVKYTFVPEPAIEQTVRLFFGQRRDRNGRVLSEKLRDVEKGEDWVRFNLMPPLVEERLRSRGYQRSWHGTRMECLMAILTDGQLLPSYSRALGHDYMEGKPAVYTHQIKTKAFGYSKWAPLKHDGGYYAPLLEVLVDREQRVQAKGSDQWLQKPGSTELLALWMYGRSYLDMHASDQFAWCVVTRDGAATPDRDSVGPAAAT